MINSMSFFAVTKKDDPDKVLTITATKKQAFEYAYTLLKNEHLVHYQTWCILNDLNAEKNYSWQLYFCECINEEEKRSYVISKIKYNKNSLSAIIRMFGNCSPIGCSYDSNIEYKYQKAKQEFEASINSEEI